MIIKKKHIEEILEKFQSIGTYMKALAREKLSYHLTLIDEIIRRYSNKEDLKELVEHR